MPRAQIKDEETYRALRREGNSEDHTHHRGTIPSVAAAAQNNIIPGRFRQNVCAVFRITARRHCDLSCHEQ